MESLIERVTRLEAENGRLQSDLALVQAAAASSLVPAFERLDRFTTYAEDWDSYGALPPTAMAISIAKTLIARVVGSASPSVGDQALPWVIAPFSEGIVLEWRAGGEAVEIEISGTGEIGYLRERRRDGKVDYDERDAISSDQTWEYVHRLFVQ